MLVDHAIIYVKAGDGGDGMVSFRREAYVPRGGPDGGNGGDGGDVIFVATPGVDTLLDMAGRHHWRADDGRPGGTKQRTGADGSPLIIRVPPGTLIYNDETGELIEDLDTPEKQIVIAHGGRGGFGNEHFKTSQDQAPRRFSPGQPGEQITLRLELKLIADIGLVGKPNAGKSTLLSRLSRARPKVADYPFTTLEPQLGIAELDVERRLVIADIPGLIEGAAGGAGLGHAFLRHIERTRILVHVLEIEPSDNSNPIDNYYIIREELNDYSSILADKTEIIALNKLDLVGGEEDVETAVEMIGGELDLPVFPISAATGLGIRELLEKCWQLSKESKAEDDA